MIQANQLRINNWLISGKRIPQQVAYIGDTIGFHNDWGGTDKHQKNPIFSHDINDIKPIPLTREIVEKCGFKLNEDLGDMQYYQIPHQSNGYGICFDHNDIEFYCFWTDMRTGEGVHVVDPILHQEEHFQYLHQFQNLYFALTGKELEVTL